MKFINGIIIVVTNKDGQQFFGPFESEDHALQFGLEFGDFGPDDEWSMAPMYNPKTLSKQCHERRINP